MSLLAQTAEPVVDAGPPHFVVWVFTCLGPVASALWMVAVAIALVFFLRAFGKGSRGSGKVYSEWMVLISTFILGISLIIHLRPIFVFFATRGFSGSGDTIGHAKVVELINHLGGLYYSLGVFTTMVGLSLLLRLVDFMRRSQP